jgi:hypothetical protein
MNVTYGPLSEWQKRDCINQHADFTCTNPAIQEAIEAPERKVQLRVGIRCCGDQACKERAAQLVRASLPSATDRLIRDTYTYHGSCGCDGALDDGCPSCTPERRKAFEGELKTLLDRYR